MTFRRAVGEIRRHGWRCTEVVRVNGGLRLNVVTKKGKPRTLRVP